jgi:diacylglycerol kinase (ATP)
LTCVHAIVNPLAGAGKTAKKWPQIKELMQSLKLDFGYTLTEAPQHAVEIARTMATKGCRFLIAIGGDGTINEVVNGLYQANCLSESKVGIICTGTGADYIRTLGIPRALDDACQLLKNPKTRLVDIGVIEYSDQGREIKRLFVNFAGLGFDAEVVKATNKTFKAMGTMSSYLMGLLFTLFSYRNINVSVMIDGRVEKRKIVTMLMGQGKYAGGGMMTTPNANPYDGLFDVLIVDNMSKLDLLWSLPRIYKGTHLTHHKVSIRRLNEIKIFTEGKVCIQADGDLIGDTPARFYVLPAALNIII